MPADVLLRPGKLNGQTRLIRRGAATLVLVWDAGEQKWNLKGELKGPKPLSAQKLEEQEETFDVKVLQSPIEVDGKKCTIIIPMRISKDKDMFRFFIPIS